MPLEREAGDPQVCGVHTCWLVRNILFTMPIKKGAIFMRMIAPLQIYYCA